MNELTTAILVLATMLGTYQVPEEPAPKEVQQVEVTENRQAGVEAELPECQSMEEEEAGGCTPPPPPVGDYFYFETEDEARAEMGWDIPCWGNEVNTWTCWVGEE